MLPQLILLLVALISEPTDWPQFRGPNSDGHAVGTTACPMDWSETKNVLWKTDIAGLGWSSPVVVGNQVFLTTAVREENRLSLRALALDANNGKQLWDYVAKKKIKTVGFERLRHGKGPASFAKSLKALAKTASQIVVSFDLDACAAAFAPGVSAAQAEGFSASEAIEMAEIAGREKKVISLGLFELNPLHDQDQRTSLLAATMAYHFVAAKLK